MKLKTSLAIAFLLCAAGSSAALAQSGKKTTVIRSTNRVTITNGGDVIVRGDVTQGSGRLVRQARQVPPFTRIATGDAMDVEVVIGPRLSVEIEADDNLLAQFVTKVEAGTLTVESTGSYSTDRAPIVRVTMPSLAALDLSGSGDGNVRALAGGRLAVTIRGSGDITAAGRLSELDVVISGSGDADLAALDAERVNIAINGSGDADVGSPHSLSATVNGSGDIEYSGSPAILRQDVNGSGSIKRRQR